MIISNCICVPANGIILFFFVAEQYSIVCFPSGSDSKRICLHEGDLGSIPGSGRSPGAGNGNPLQYPLPGEFHGQRSLAGSSPWGHKESETTGVAGDNLSD